MKSNELFEMIHSGKIKENTKIDVKTEKGLHIAYINYKNKKLNWVSGEFDTRYLCDIEIEFEIVKPEWEIEKLNLLNMDTGEKINAIENKVNEIINNLNKTNKPFTPFMF